MEPINNPFAPGAGTQPPELAGRDAVLRQADVVLDRFKLHKPERGIIFVGLRGVGKTVLLNKIKEKADKKGYLTVDIEAPEDKNLVELLVPPLRQVLLRLDTISSIKVKLKEALGVLRNFAAAFKVEIGDFGIGVDPQLGFADSGVLDNDVSDLFVAVGGAAKESSTVVALFIDELQYVKEKELAALLSGVHKVTQLNLPLVVFAAGLPQISGLTGKAKSYAERLFRFQEVGPLNTEDAEKAIEKPLDKEGISIEAAALSELVNITEGYPYFLQMWGSHAWLCAETSPIVKQDVKTATNTAVNELDSGFFRVRFDRLTKSEKEYLRAMAEFGNKPCRSGDVALKLLRPVEQVAPIRAKVIAKGMAYAPAHGDIAFTVPKFSEYMLRVMPTFEPQAIRKYRK